MLLQLGLFVALYIYTNLMSEFVFDERLFNVMPMAIYFSTVFWFYVNWFFFVQVNRAFLTMGQTRHLLFTLHCKAFYNNGHLIGTFPHL